MLLLAIAWPTNDKGRDKARKLYSLAGKFHVLHCLHSILVLVGHVGLVLRLLGVLRTNEANRSKNI